MTRQIDFTNQGGAMTLLVLVPKPGTAAENKIAPGSGIVCHTDQFATEGRVRVYYEGNLYGAVNLVTYQDRVGQAAGRLVTHEPTIATAVFPVADFLMVGTFNYTTRFLEIVNGEAVDDWTGQA
jgi:hypothetical protein